MTPPHECPVINPLLRLRFSSKSSQTAPLAINSCNRRTNYIERRSDAPKYVCRYTLRRYLVPKVEERPERPYP